MTFSAKPIYEGIYGFLLLLLSLTLAWAILFRFDFFYGVWHDHAGIKQGIDTYAPQNYFKRGFGDTTRDQRVEVFHQINLAVHNSGRGLEDISYQSPTSNGVQKVLREAEIIHLIDVANLIDRMAWLMAAVFCLWLGLAIYYVKKYAASPSLIFQAQGLAVVFLLMGLVLIIFGAENVFNALHIWLFPKENQWFFYYQESLMSTMMLAPQLFAWIALSWAVIAVAIFFLINVLLKRGLNQVMKYTQGV